MSNEVNTRLEERLIETFEETEATDYKFWACLARNGIDVHDHETIYERILEEFNNCEGTTFDIRELASKAYGIEF